MRLKGCECFSSISWHLKTTSRTRLKVQWTKYTECSSSLKWPLKVWLGLFKSISWRSLLLLLNDSLNREMQSIREKFNFQITRGQRETHIGFLSVDIKSSCFIWIKTSLHSGKTSTQRRRHHFPLAKPSPPADRKEQHKRLDGWRLFSVAATSGRLTLV